MRSLISRMVTTARLWPTALYVMAMTSVIVWISASTASAKGIDKCTTTKATKDAADLIVASVLNPIKTYGWAAVIVIALVAAVAAIFASSATGLWKRVLWGFALMVVLVPLAGTMTSTGGGPC